MKLNEVTALLELIQSIDRKPFPANAAPAWLPILHGIEYRDAEQAVNDHYRSYNARDGKGDLRPILPVDIRTRASALKEHRQRAEARHALPGPKPRVGSVGRPPEVEAELARARELARQAAERHAASERVSVAA
jgi:hypothetical protein